MKQFKSKTATDLRSTLYDTLKEVSDGEPLIVTHKQGEDIVMLSKIDYNEILRQADIHKQIALGVADFNQGHVIANDDVQKHFTEKVKKWKSSGPKQRIKD